MITANDDGDFAIADLPPSSYELRVGDAPRVVVVLGVGEHATAQLNASK
jgi:hypothetical protein